MDHIKHYSFDLWFTLIKSDPRFKKERALFFYEKFNSLNKTIEDVELAFRHIDRMCNSINEKTGRNIEAEEMYLMVIFQLNNSFQNFENLDMRELYKEMEQLIFKYIPTHFNSETELCLDRIKQDADKTINILSNTGFIKGSTLRIIVDNLNLSKYFDFQIYSDEVGLSKPNAEMYKVLLKNIFSSRKQDTILLSEILHVGDNPIADIFGAERAGINAFQINSNDKIITHIFNAN